MKKFFKYLAVAVVAIAILLALIPTIVSTQAGKPLMFTAVNSQIFGKVYADDVRASWFSGFELGNVTLEDQKGKRVATISKITFKAPLLSMLYSPFPTGTLTVKAPEVLLTDSQGQLVISEVLQPTQNSQAKPLPRLTLTNLEFSLDLQAGKEASLDLHCLVVGEGEKPGKIDLQAKASNVLELQDALQELLTKEGTKTKANAEIKLTIDSLPIKGSVLEQALGNTLTLHLEQKLQENEVDLSLSAQSAYLHSEIEAHIKNGIVSIPKKAYVNYTITPDFVSKLAPDLSSENPVTIQCVLDPIKEASLQNLKDVPLSLTVTQDKPFRFTKKEWKSPLGCSFSGKIASTSVAKEVTATGLVATTFQNQELKGELAVKVYDPFTALKANADIQFEGNGDVLSAFVDKKLIGDKISFALKTTLDQEKIDGSWNAESSTIKNKGSFSLANNTLVLNPTTLDIKFPKDAITSSPFALHAELKKAEFPEDVNQAVLDCAIFVEPLVMNNITAKDTTLFMTKEKGENAKIVGKTWLDSDSIKGNVELLVDQFDLRSSKIQALASFSNVENALMPFDLEAPINLDLEKQSISGSLDFRGERASLKARFEVMPSESRFALLPPLKGASSGTFHDFPVTLLSVLTQKPELPELLGSTLSGEWNVGFDATLEKPQNLSLSVQGQDLSLQLALGMHEELSGNNPLSFSWTVSPARFQLLQKLIQDPHKERAKTLMLQKPVVISASSKKFRLPLTPFLEGKSPMTTSALLDLLSCDIGITTSALDALLVEKKEGGHEGALYLPSLKAYATLSEKMLTFNVTSDSTINIQGQAKDLWGKEGIHLDKADLKLDVKIKELPLELLQGITSKPETAEKWLALFGKNISAVMLGNVENLTSGTFNGTITSPTLKSTVSCSLTDGALKLSRPLEAQYELTPEAGEQLLKDINPLLASAAHTQKPITLKIDSEGFFLPLRPFSMKEVRIQNITIDPGILTCKNSGMLSLLTALLKVKVKEGKDIDLWFTPIYAEVKKGVVHCKRTDALLANAFPIATWGSINLEKNSVDMTLGLSGKAVSLAFGIKDLDPEYLLQIPIHGPTNSPKFDTVRASAKITGMKMQQKNSNTTALLGGLIEIAASAGEKEEPAPAPTTYPFPWSPSEK